MTRRRVYRSRAERLRLRGAERILVIVGAVVYAVGLLGGLTLLPMPATTTILLLALGGGLLLAALLSLVF